MTNFLTLGFILMVACVTICFGGNDYYFESNPPKEILAVNLDKTENAFFTGDNVIRGHLIWKKSGFGDCLNYCHKEPLCESFNLGLSKEGEWFCELTKFFKGDDDYTIQPRQEGDNNYSFTVRRNPQSQTTTKDK